MVKKALTVSIVIPVYNEEGYIGACLDAIVVQTVGPYEVIIVDNNCTDKTVEIAQKYPRVKVVQEKVQGRTTARNAGFNAAQGDIIGRIDADSMLMPTWVERIQADLQDPNIDGVTGLGKTRVLPLTPNWYSTFWVRLYFWTTNSLFRAVTMWGANMALRRVAWQKIKHDVAQDGSHVHEDQDLSFVLQSHGGRIIQDQQLLIRTAGISYLYWPKFWAYFKKSLQMRAYHRAKGTFDKMGSNRLGFWQCLPGAVIGWTFTGLFFIYSLVMWPVLFLMFRFSKNPSKWTR